MANRRRGRGEGSIKQRADGRWEGRLDLGWVNGRRSRKTIYGDTRREVADELAQLHQQLKVGQLLATTVLLIRSFVPDWLNNVAKPRIRPRTWLTYETAVRLHIVPYLGTLRVSRLKPQDIQAWLGRLSTEGVSASRQRYARVVLRAALNTAVRWNLTAINVAALVEPPRVVQRAITPLSPAQAKQLLKAAAGGDLEAFLTVGVSCGLRVGEALALRWTDVDLTAGTLSVRRAVQRTGGDPAVRRELVIKRRKVLKALAETEGPNDAALQQELKDTRKQLQAVKTTLQFVEPKSVRSRRTIALPRVTSAALRVHRRRQLETKLAAGERWQDTGLIFSTTIGTPMEVSNLTKAFKALLKQAGLPGIRLHDLRHTAATLLLTQGVSPRVVMETLGHSQISLTMNTYSHVLPELQRQAADKMDAALAK